MLSVALSPTKFLRVYVFLGHGTVGNVSTTEARKPEFVPPSKMLI